MIWGGWWQEWVEDEKGLKTHSPRFRPRKVALVAGGGFLVHPVPPRLPVPTLQAFKPILTLRDPPPGPGSQATLSATLPQPQQ